MPPQLNSLQTEAEQCFQVQKKDEAIALLEKTVLSVPGKAVLTHRLFYNLATVARLPEKPYLRIV